jgi:hypothetical protein
MLMAPEVREGARNNRVGVSFFGMHLRLPSLINSETLVNERVPDIGESSLKVSMKAPTLTLT